MAGLCEPNIEAIHWQQRYDTVLRECETHQDIISAQTKQIHEFEQQRDAAIRKADQYERDWIDAKRDFGDRMAEARTERDALAERVRVLENAVLQALDHLNQLRWVRVVDPGMVEVAAQHTDGNTAEGEGERPFLPGLTELCASLASALGHKGSRRECPQCGKTYTVFPSRHRIFCSAACRVAARRGKTPQEYFEQSQERLAAAAAEPGAACKNCDCSVNYDDENCNCRCHAPEPGAALEGAE